MSLPLTRRIARAALLIAAGAAPVAGAAGTAGAAELTQAPLLGALSAPSGEALGDTLDGTAREGARTAGETGGRLVGTAAPVAKGVVGEAAPVATETVGGAAQAVGGGLPTGSLPLGG